MKRAKFFIMTGILFSLLTLSLLTELRCETQVRVAPMKSPPVIDGKIGSEEWQGGVSFAGLGDPLEPREGSVWFGYDQNNLYFAFRTEMPPNGKLETNIKKRNGDVVSDDSVELWIVPPKEGRKTDGSPRSLGYFQLILNSAGVIYDRQHEPGYGLAPLAWNVKLETASKVSAEGYWEIEIAIPFREFGMEKLVFPSEWRMRLVRNWQNGGNQSSIPQSSSFSDVKGMMPVIFDKESAVIQVRSARMFSEGSPEIKVGVFNPTDKAVKTEVEVVLKSGDNPVLDEKQTLSIAPGQEEVYESAPVFTPKDKNSLSVTVTDKDNRKVLYQRGVIFGLAPAHKWNMIEDFLTFRLSFDNETRKAEKSKGNPEPIEVTGETTFVEGVVGKALYLKNGAEVTYDQKNNLTIPGAVSFWIQFKDDPKATYFWWTRNKEDGYLGFQNTGDLNLNIWVQYFPGIFTKNITGGINWKKGQWYHFLLNFYSQKIELYRDGINLAQGSLERPLNSNELAPFIIGYGNNEYAIDELQIFSRPLTLGEIQKLASGNSPGSSVGGWIAWLPSRNAVAVEAYAPSDTLQKFKFAVVVSDGNRNLFESLLKKEGWQKTAIGTSLVFRDTINVPDLPEGTYSVFLQEIESDGGKGKELLRRDIIVKHYSWLHNNLGESEVVIPPFTPLEVSGNKVKSVLRTHTLGNLGLWQQVESEGKEILSRPISLNVESAGKLLNWQSKPVKVTETKPNRVRVEGQAENELMEVKSECEFDYDGLMKVTLNITPKGNKTLDQMWLEIPVKEEEGSLFHAVGEHIRANPAGFVPKGEGVVWQSRSLPQPHIENFIPYIWVGGEERGICWAADWDKDWVHSVEHSAVELVRTKGEVVIRVNLINGPIQLNRSRSIEFALQASPVKPMPEGWRDMVYDFDSPGRTRFHILWPPAYGGHYGWASRYPLDEDWTIIQKLSEAQKTGNVDQNFIEQWIKKVKEHPGNLTFREVEANLRAEVNFGFNVAKSFYQRKPPGKLMPYSCGCESPDLLPEFPVFGDEWKSPMHASASFRDYAVWYADKMMENGMGGIYFDNSFFAAKYNWPMGEAYIGDDGEVHPSLGLWRVRELVKRLAVMMYEKGRDPFVYVHMTNGNVLPILAFAQANLDWEWKRGGNDYQERFTPDFIRAESMGRQAGTIPNVLGGITGVAEGSEEYIHLTRTGLAMALPHQIFFYAYSYEPTCAKAREIISPYVSQSENKSYFYWENQAIIKAPDNLMVTIHQAKDKLLLVIGNLGEGGDYEIGINPEKIGFSKISSAVNRETDVKVPVQGNNLKVSIKKHDFALIEVQLLQR